jgi:hypothetical protein
MIQRCEVPITAARRTSALRLALGNMGQLASPESDSSLGTKERPNTEYGGRTTNYDRSSAHLVRPRSYSIYSLE